MMEIHVPTERSVKALGTTLGYLTEGLDAVSIGHEESEVYPGHTKFTIVGNPRDLETVVQRAAKVGGKID